MSDLLAEIATAVIEGKSEGIAALTEKALSEGLGAKQILDKGFMPGMDHVGEAFKRAEMFVPDVLLSARVMQASMGILKPRLVESGAEMTGKLVIGTVQGDLHDIGKNLVAMMIEGAGFEVFDLGNDVSPEAFVQAVKEHKPGIVGMSALLTTTMRAMDRTMEALKEAGLRDQVKIMIGGAPVTSDFAQQIGADVYCSNATTAKEAARRFVGV
jgi:5-methyltetrahydrofolate--homocysteine methyltransferase